jgi:hypothetical protein
MHAADTADGGRADILEMTIVDDPRFARLSSFSIGVDTSNRGEESHDGR